MPELEAPVRLYLAIVDSAERRFDIYVEDLKITDPVLVAEAAVFKLTRKPAMCVSIKQVEGRTVGIIRPMSGEIVFAGGQAPSKDVAGQTVMPGTEPENVGKDLATRPGS